MLRGRFVHANIIESSPVKSEVSVGWIVHYLLGAGVALTYPFYSLALDVPIPGGHLISGLGWGLATTLLPWFTNFPAFGWGFFGVRAPKGTRPLIAPAIAHGCYGVGVGLVFVMTAAHHGV